MKFYFLTLFPELIRPWLSSSILGLAHRKGLFYFDTLSPRDFAQDKHSRVDDIAYGGGGGMVLKVEPLARAVELMKTRHPDLQTIYFAPQGDPLTIFSLERMAALPTKNYLLVCGHYEGVDQRFIDGWVDQIISVGDFVVTGGELPAVLFADAFVRQLDGTLRTHGASEESFSLKSRSGRFLEYPHFTRPSEFLGKAVPEVLLSGNHKAIANWRNKQCETLTQARRPDLLDQKS